MTQDDYLLYGFSILVGIVVWTMFVRFVFRIKRTVKNQEATIRLLEQIALNSNVDIEKVKEIERIRTETFADHLGI